MILLICCIVYNVYKVDESLETPNNDLLNNCLKIHDVVDWVCWGTVIYQEDIRGERSEAK